MRRHVEREAYSYSNKRYGVQFGKGEDAWMRMPDGSSETGVEYHAYRLGWVAGCPVVTNLIQHRDPYIMASKYSEYIKGYDLAIARSSRLNEGVHTMLTSFRARRPEEPVGKHERRNVPRSFLKTIPPMATLEGYAVSRMMAVATALNGADFASEMLSEALRETGPNPFEFVPNLAEVARRNGMPQDTILHNVYPAAILIEEGINHHFRRVAETLEIHAPILYKALTDLTPTDRSRLAIAQIPA